MHKTTRKYLSFLLSIIMILSCCNGFVMAVYADDELIEEIAQEAFSEEPLQEESSEYLGEGSGEEPCEEPGEDAESIQEEISEDVPQLAEPLSLGAPLGASALGESPEEPEPLNGIEVSLEDYVFVAEEDAEVSTTITSISLDGRTLYNGYNGWNWTVEGLTAAGYGVHYVTVSGITKKDYNWSWRTLSWESSEIKYADASAAWYICSEEKTLTKGTDTASETVSGEAELLCGDAVEVVVNEGNSTITALNKGKSVVKVGETYVLYDVALRQLSDAEITLGKNVYLYNGESHFVWPDVAITTTHWAFSLREGWYVEEEEEYLNAAEDWDEESGDFEIVSGGEAVYPGKHTLVLRGVGDFEGELTADWYICSSAEAFGAATESKQYSKASVVMSSGALEISEAEGTVNISVVSVPAVYSRRGKLLEEAYCKDGEAVICVEHTGRWLWWDYTRDEYIYVKVNPEIGYPEIADDVFVASEGAVYSLEYSLSAFDGSVALTEGRDYIVSGTTQAEAAGKYTATFTGTGNYAGSWDIDWYICSEEIDLMSGETYQFGSRWDSADEIWTSVDMFSWFNEINIADKSWAGPCSIEFAGEGSKVIELKKNGSLIPLRAPSYDYVLINVEKYDLADAEINIYEDVFIWDSYVHEVYPVVSCGGVMLIKDEDYNLDGGEFADTPGKHTVTVSADIFSDYKGEISADWYIADELLILDEANDNASYYYGGLTVIRGDDAVEVSQPDIRVLRDHNGYISAKETTGSALVRVNQPVSGTKYVYVLVNPQMSDVDFATEWSFTYDGTEKAPDYKPALLLEDCTIYLQDGVDYKAYGDLSATEVGIYTITYAGIDGRFDGEIAYTWEITESDISEAEIIYTDEYNYNGELQTVGAISVSFGGIVLKEGIDYEIDGVTEATDAGVYTFKVTGKGNYSGEKDLNWIIHKLAITPGSINWGTTSYEYNQTISHYSVTPVVSVAGLTLEAGKDFILTGNTAEAAGNHTARIITKPDSNFVVADDASIFNIFDLTNVISQDWEVNNVISVRQNLITALGRTVVGANWRCEDESIADLIVMNGMAYAKGLELGTARVNHYDIGLITTNDYDVIVKVLPKDYYTDAYFSLSNGNFEYDGTEKSVSVSAKLSTGVACYTEGVDYTVEGTLSAIEAGTYYVTISAITGHFEPLTLSWTITERPAPAPVYYYAPDPTVQISVSGKDNTVKVSGTVSGNTLTVKDFTNDKDQKSVLGEDVKTGIITFEADKLGKTITSVVMPQTVVKKVADAINDEENDAEGFAVVLSNATVEFDSQAALAIAKNVPEKDRLTLNVNTNGNLNSAQKIAIEGLDTEIVLDIYLTSNNQRISDFEGGIAKISVPYTLKDGQDASGVQVWYVSESGEKEAVPCRYENGCIVFEVGHFSNYVVAWNSECPQDERCPLSGFSDLDPMDENHDGIHFCLTNDFMLGFGDGTFRAEDIETKAQLAAVLYRIAQSEGQGFSGTWMFYPDCADAGDIPEYAYEAVCWLVMNGVLEKDAEGYLDINGGLTREEYVSILYKFAEIMDYDLGDPLPAVEWADAEAILDDEKYKIEEALKVCRGDGASAIQAFLASCVQ